MHGGPSHHTAIHACDESSFWRWLLVYSRTLIGSMALSKCLRWVQCSRTLIMSLAFCKSLPGHVLHPYPSALYLDPSPDRSHGRSMRTSITMDRPMQGKGDVPTIHEHAMDNGLLAQWHCHPTVHMSFAWADIPSARLPRRTRTASTLTKRPQHAQMVRTGPPNHRSPLPGCTMERPDPCDG